jgi:signal transduction histidine kinase
MALRDFVEAVARQERLEARVETEEVEGLSPEAETALYRVAQEAVRNVVRHAGASRLSVSLREDGGAAEVIVHDDGSGFVSDGADFVREGHFGIAGMRERVDMVGGHLEIVSQPGAGTTIRARIPTAAASTATRAPARGHPAQPTPRGRRKPARARSAR